MTMEENEDFYRGRESVWQELYKQVCHHAAELEKKVDEHSNKTFHESEDRAMITNQSKIIDDLELKVGALEVKVKMRDDIIKESDKFLLGLYESIMAVNNLSAEERMSYLRSHYKTDYDNLKLGKGRNS